MKTFLIQIMLLSSSILNAQESIYLNLINEKTRLYEKPSFSANSIEMLNKGSDFEVLDFDNKIQKNNGMNGIWIKIENPFGWIFSSNLNIDTSVEISCDFNFNSVRKFSFNNFEIIFLKKQLVILSSFDLGNSFNQQIGTWKWKGNRIVSSVKFTDSTMTDCLNICYESENNAKCKSECKRESMNKFGKLFVEADIEFELNSINNKPSLIFKKIKEYNLKKNPFFSNFGFIENKRNNAICPKS